jgi:ferric-dicitrate binding protein FerR (iron transport regulator)
MTIDELICRSLRGDTSDVEEKRLSQWRRESSWNESHYQSTIRMLEFVDASGRDVPIPPAPSVTLLIRRANRQPLHRSEKRRDVSRVFTTGIMTAAIAAMITVLVFGDPFAERELGFSLGAGEFVTGARETATVTLADGTVVRLAPGSRLRISERRDSREVFLDGQAFFAVMPMPEYPFRVRTQAGDAMVLGTRFEILTHGDDLRLVVLEGRVALGSSTRPVEVNAGEVSQVSGGTTTAPVVVGDIKPMVSWLDRFLVFQETPLPEVARLLEEEYGVRVEVIDSDLSRQTITGWYADRTFEEVFEIICGVLQATCTTGEGGARIGSQDQRRSWSDSVAERAHIITTEGA